jgi:hypothetical protein
MGISLGALAGGVASGMETGQRMLARKQTMDATRKQQEEQQAFKRDTDAADAAMRERLKGFEAEHQQAQPKAPAAYRTLGGTDSSMPDQSAVDQAPAAASPFRPNQQQLLAAAQTRTDKLFELGRHDAAVKQWAQDEGLRSQMRQQAVEQGAMAFKASGDIRPLLTGVYQTIDDGYDVGNIEKVNNPDPKAPASWNVERVHARTGEKEVKQIGADQVEGLIDFAMDPKKAAQYALMQKLAGYKADEQRQTNAARGTMTLDQIGKRNEGNMAVAEARGETARDVAQVRVDGTITAAKLRAASSGGKGQGGAAGVQSKTVLGDGRIVLHMRDGTSKVAAMEDGTPMSAIDYEKLVGSTANTVAKSLDGMTASPEKNRERARSLLPQQPAKTARPLGSGADYSKLWN